MGIISDGYERPFLQDEPEHMDCPDCERSGVKDYEEGVGICSLCLGNGWFYAIELEYRRKDQRNWGRLKESWQ